jgi:hypothetical protein
MLNMSSQLKNECTAQRVQAVDCDSSSHGILSSGRPTRKTMSIMTHFKNSPTEEASFSTSRT